MMLNRASRNFCISFLAILFCYDVLPGVAQQAPEPQREVNIGAVPLFNPIQFIGLIDQGNIYAAPKSAVKVIRFIDGNPDWIGNISLTIENHSTKHIVAIELLVSVMPAWIPDVFHTSHAILFHEGQLPEHALHLADGTPIPEEFSMTFDVKPGTSVNVPLKQAYLKLAKVLDRDPSLIPLASVDSIRLELYRIFFANGTEWQAVHIENRTNLHQQPMSK